MRRALALLFLFLCCSAVAGSPMTELKEGRYGIVAKLVPCGPSPEVRVCALVYGGSVQQRHLALAPSMWDPSLRSAMSGAPRLRWELVGEWRSGEFKLLEEPRHHSGGIAAEDESAWIRKLD